MPSQLYPEVIDGSTLGAKRSEPIFLPIGAEGQIDNVGTGILGAVYSVSRPSEADTLFGPVSSLGAVVKFLLGRGVNPVLATPSKKGSAPLLADRQAAWGFLESDKNVRIRVTDSVVQAELDALATSCENASLINHKQFSMVGLASATTKANLIAAAGAVASSRCTLIGPGVHDNNGVLMNGLYSALATAAEVARNPDPGDDLDTLVIPNLTGIEKDAGGLPMLRVKVSAGAVVTNDFEDLLQGGVSPLMPSRDGGGVAIAHLRMTDISGNGMWDALSSRIIVDQIFVLVREYCYEKLALRKQNTPENRQSLSSGVQSLLNEHRDWISPIVQPDGSEGYGVEVIASADKRQMIIGYEGDVVRNTQTILVNGQLNISV